MAGVMGVTQRQVLHEYFWVDLARMAAIIRKQEALRKMELLNIINARNLEEKDYRELIRRYMKEAEFKEKSQKFDRSKFEELRALDM